MAGSRPAARNLRRGLFSALLCLPLLLGLAAPVAAQTTRTLDIQVADAYEGENIIVTLTLSSAFGSLTEAARTITVATDAPTADEVNTCIASDVGSPGEKCTAGGTPASASDFTATSTSVVFGTNETVKTVSIPTTTDNLSEGLEVVELAITNFGTGIANLTGRDAFNLPALIFPNSVIVNSFGQISDGSRPAPEISIAPGMSPVMEGTAASFTVTATPAQRTSQSVNLTVTQSGSFVASGDLGGSKTVTIGTSGEATYTVPTVDDSTVEANGSVTVTVNSGTGYTVASAPNNAATVTVENNDIEVSISAPTDANEGNSGTTNKLFSVTLSSAHTAPISARVCYSGTATRGASDDYQSRFSTAISTDRCATRLIPTGDTSINAHGIQIRGDTDAEPDETVIATLSLVNPPAGVVLGTSTATYTILDDDDTTVPGVTSIERHSPTAQYTNADSLTWRVTFSEAVRNVDMADFSLVLLTTTIAFPGTTALDVSSVSTSVYDIRATGSGIENADNSIQLVFASGHDIEDLSGNDLPASPSIPGASNDNYYTLDNTAPTVRSIERLLPTTAMTDEDSLTWRVTFADANSGEVRDVVAADFQVTGTTATLAVNEDSLNVYDVTASGGDLANLNGTVTLSFANNHNIVDNVGNALASTTPTSGTNDNTFNVQNVVVDAGAPELVSIKRHEQAFNHPRWAPGLLCPALVWEVKFDKPMPPVHASDFTLTGSSAGLDIFSNLSDFSIVYVVAKCGGLETVSGPVTLNVASNHNIRDFEGRALASTTPTSGTNQSFTLNPNETLVYFTQENYYVDEGNEAVVTLRLSRLRDTATTISALSATPLTATGNGVDYHGQTYSVTIPAYRASGTLRIRTSNDTLTEEKETFRVDIHGPLLPAGVAVTTAPGATGNDGQTYIHIRDEDTATAKANKEPGLVFDNAHLTWNEADGCGNTGPTYNVKLKTEPLGPVEVFIEDPDDNYRSDYVAKGRLSIDNTPPSAGEQGGAYEIHDDGTYSTHPLPKLDEHTVLRFTPGNWDKYQLVNVKVRCSDHYTAQIPIKHRMYTNYIGDKGKLSHAYPGYSGVVDKGWTVHVYIRESDPPIVLKHLPAPGQPVDVKEGSHLDFEITLSEAAFKHDSSLTVYLSARGGKAAGVKRRDGRAQSCGGPLDDCLIFTPSNRTQWVRLFAIGPGRDELKVEIPQLRWGGLEHVRDWEMRWPVEVEHAGICGRTKAVRDAIVGRIGGVSHCRDVTPEHLAGIGGRLYLDNIGLRSVQAGDFDGLTSLTKLDLDRNQLTSLPAGIFDQLTSLTHLELYDNSSLAPLPAGIFDQLTKLEYLDMDNIGLTTLPAGIFDQHQELNVLWLRNNHLEALPENIFHKTRKLHTLRLQNNPGAPFRPTADAGPDQTVSTGAQVTLSSTATGPWGDNLRFRWWQVDGPNSDTIVTTGVTLSSATSTAPTFTAPAAPTVLHFRLSAEPVVFGTLNLAGLGNSFAWVTITVGGGQGSPQQDALAAQDETPSCVSDALLADAQLAASETWRTSPGHVERWSRVLAAFGVDNAYSHNPMTVAEAQAQADRGLKRWAPVAPALECLAAAPEEQPEQAEVQPVTPATPEIGLSAGSAVDEGGNATFTVTAAPAPQSDLTIAWTVAQSGEYLDAPGAGSRTVTLTAGATSADLAVATVDDAADEADGSVSVTLESGTGYTLASGKGSAAVAVRDNDEPVVSIAAGNGVTEGTSASFTVSASPVPAAPLDVTLAVAQSGDFAASGETGSRTVTVPVTGSVDVEVATVDDGADEPDGSVTASVDAGTGYAVAAAPANAATVTVTDNDATTPSTGPTISIADATMNENQHNGWFTVTLSEKVAWPVHVYYATRDSSPVSAVAGQDYLAWKRSWQLRARFRPGQTETKIHVPLYNDSHDEDPETFEMVLFDAGVNGPPGVSVSIADGIAVGTITNDDPMPKAWLSRFGRTVAEQALDAVADRMAAARTPGLDVALAGHALGAEPDEGEAGAMTPSERRAARAEREAAEAMAGIARGIVADTHGTSGDLAADPMSMDARDALLASGFTLTTGSGDGGSTAFWGRAARSGFDGHDGTFSLDGEATTVTLGADHARGRWLAGLALLRSSGDGSYRDDGTGSRDVSRTCAEAGGGMDPEARAVPCGGAVREGDGTVEATLSAAVPYAALQASERIGLWGALGTGTGEVTLRPETGGALSSDLSWSMAAAGLRGDLLDGTGHGSGPALAVVSDALWTRTRSERTHELAASGSVTSRLRLGLEGGWTVALGNGGSLSPRLEAGLRHDGGDAETGFGIDLGGGIAWTDPARGLSLGLSGRTLVAHEDGGFRDRGLALDVAWDPRPETGRGWSASLSRSLGGSSSGGVAALLGPEAFPDASPGGGGAWSAEVAHGTALGAGMVASPYGRVGGTLGAKDEVRLGWRAGPDAPHAEDATLDLWAEPVTGGGGRAVGAGLEWRW